MKKTRSRKSRDTVPLSVCLGLCGMGCVSEVSSPTHLDCLECYRNGLYPEVTRQLPGGLGRGEGGRAEKIEYLEDKPFLLHREKKLKLHIFIHVTPTYTFIIIVVFQGPVSTGYLPKFVTKDFLCLATGRALTTISQKRKKHSELCSVLFSEKKNLWKLVPHHSRSKKHMDDFWKTIFWEFCSVPFRISERVIPNTQNSTKGALFSTE
jgi:hypothetical protein